MSSYFHLYFVVFLHQNCSKDFTILSSYDRANQMDFLSELRASTEAHNCGWTEKVQPRTYTIHLMNLVVRRKLWAKKKSLE